MKWAKPQETNSVIRFTARLSQPEATETTGSWNLTLPKNASAKLPSRGRMMVEGTINSFPFRAALELNGKGSHGLRVNKTMRDAARADAGEAVTVEIMRTGEEPEIRVPMAQLSSVKRPGNQHRCGQTTPTRRRERARGMPASRKRSRKTLLDYRMGSWRRESYLPCR
jgi:hypothetical protein